MKSQTLVCLLSSAAAAPIFGQGGQNPPEPRTVSPVPDDFAKGAAPQAKNLVSHPLEDVDSEDQGGVSSTVKSFLGKLEPVLAEFAVYLSEDRLKAKEVLGKDLIVEDAQKELQEAREYYDSVSGKLSPEDKQTRRQIKDEIAQLKLAKNGFPHVAGFEERVDELQNKLKEIQAKKGVPRSNYGTSSPSINDGSFTSDYQSVQSDFPGKDALSQSDLSGNPALSQSDLTDKTQNDGSTASKPTLVDKTKTKAKAAARGVQKGVAKMFRGNPKPEDKPSLQRQNNIRKNR